jgi:hypothetical protein
MSSHPSESSGYSIEDINTALMRRGRRRARNKSNVLGGVSVVHPARLKHDIKTALRAHGYGASGDEGGLWEGVRADALELLDWRRYAKYEPHGHSIGFPELIGEHSHESFVINKYDVLEAASNVVAHVRYLMSHRGVWRGDGQFTSVRRWGMFHHASGDYIDVEEALERDAYEDVCERVADAMGAAWSETEGLHYPEKGEPCCPACGTSKANFIALWDLPRLASSKNQGGQEWINRLSDSQREFFDELMAILHHDGAPIIERGDIPHPDDVAPWIDGDRPPD